MQLIRDLYYLASEAVQVPVRLVQALAEGVALGWETRPSDDVDEITHGPAWHNDDHCPTATCGSCPAPVRCEALRRHLTSSADGEAISPLAEERPSPDCVIRPAPGGGHPNLNQRRLHDVAAFGLSEWLKGEPCEAPTLFRSIIHDLEQLTK